MHDNDRIEAAQRGLEDLKIVLSGLPQGARLISLSWDYTIYAGNNGEQHGCIHLAEGITNPCEDGSRKPIKCIPFDAPGGFPTQLAYIEHGVFVFQILSKDADAYFQKHGTLPHVPEDFPVGGDPHD